MSETYRIICVNTTKIIEGHKAHISSVGTGSASRWSRQWGVGEVRTAIANGDVFYTSNSAGKIALVHPFDCGKCGYKTLRSAADAVTDNNLDELPSCDLS
jgi:hypothetical protein